MVFLRVLRGFCCASRFFSTASAVSSTSSFSAKEFRRFPITQITSLNHDTKVLRLGLETPTSSTGMSVSSLIMVKGESESARPYTPISLKEDLGYFELLVKTYPQGDVSSYVHGLKVGQELEVKGPFAKLAYTANMKKHICLLAGGSGITPCLQVIKEVLRLKAEGDTTEIKLLYANRKEEDILLRDLLDQLSSDHDNFSVEYILSQPSARWQGKTGRISASTSGLEEFLPPPSTGVLVYVCGPPGFMAGVCGDKLPSKEQGQVGGVLQGLGYTENMVYKF